VSFAARFRDSCEDADEKEVGVFMTCAQAETACEAQDLTRAHWQYSPPHLEWNRDATGRESAEGCDGALYDISAE
jgi:hypothetical protein